METLQTLRADGLGLPPTGEVAGCEVECRNSRGPGEGPQVQQGNAEERLAKGAWREAGEVLPKRRTRVKGSHLPGFCGKVGMPRLTEIQFLSE